MRCSNSMYRYHIPAPKNSPTPSGAAVSQLSSSHLFLKFFASHPFGYNYGRSGCFILVSVENICISAFNHNELSYSAISLSALFITSLPHILGVVPTNSPDLGDRTIAYQVLWPLCFAASFATLAFYLVRLEKELKKDEVRGKFFKCRITLVKLMAAEKSYAFMYYVTLPP